MTYGHLQADCLYTGISSGPNARCRVWEAFTFLPLYSPDLVPSDFYLFPLLKEHLSGTHFSNDNDVIASVEVFLHGQDELFYKTGIQKLQK